MKLEKKRGEIWIKSNCNHFGLVLSLSTTVTLTVTEHTLSGQGGSRHGITHTGNSTSTRDRSLLARGCRPFRNTTGRFPAQGGWTRAHNTGWWLNNEYVIKMTWLVRDVTLVGWLSIKFSWLPVTEDCLDLTLILGWGRFKELLELEFDISPCNSLLYVGSSDVRRLSACSLKCSANPQ